MVLAGPGSGKTFIITHRIHQLLLSKSATAEQILVITFTRKAAGEMRERFLSSDIPNREAVTFGTFHSVYYQILKQNNPGTYLSIISYEEKLGIIEKILFHNRIYRQSVYFTNDNIEDIIRALSYYKSTGFNLPDGYPEELFRIFYKEYSEALLSINKLDYDDIILECNRLLNENPKVCLALKNKFKYILVDEFQDINLVQYEVLIKIINEQRNLFIVGDDDQSIYGFRGASGMIMNRFLKDFENTIVYKLKNNYRSVFQILEPAGKVISENPGRLKDYDLFPVNDTTGVFRVRLFEDRTEELNAIKNIINERGKEKSVILVRTNKDVDDYRILLSGKSKTGQTRAEIKKEVYYYINAYVSFSIYQNRISIIKVIKCPPKLLSRNVFNEDTIDLGKLSSIYSRSYKGAEIAVLKRHFDILDKLKPYGYIHYLFNVCGLDRYFKEKYTETEYCVYEEIRNDIMNKCKSFTRLNELEEMTFITEESKIITNSDIQIMTFHASKGLEFDTVIIPDAIEGKIPGHSFKRGEGDEEERRLFYVAMTRAANELHIMAIKNEGTNKLVPSRFISPFIEDYSSSNSSSSRYSSNLSYTASSSSSSSI